MKAKIRNFLFDFFARKGVRANRMRPEINRIAIYYIDGKLGDSVYLKLIADALKNHFEIHAFTTKNLVGLWEESLPKQRIIICSPRTGRLSPLWIAQQAMARLRYRNFFDCIISIESGKILENAIFLRIMNPKYIIGCGKENYSLYDENISDSFSLVNPRPIINKVHATLSLFQATFSLPELKSSAEFRVFLNTYGATLARSFAFEQISAMGKLLAADNRIAKIIISLDQKYSSAVAQLESISSKIRIMCGKSIDETIKEIDECNVCITPDTGISHLSASRGIPTLVFFSDTDFHPIAWRPDFPWVKIIVPEKETPLWNLPEEVCVREIHSFLDFINGIKPPYSSE